MAQVGRDLKDHEAPTIMLHAAPPTSTFNSRPGCHGPIQPGLEHVQGWGIHSLSGQPDPAPHPTPHLSPTLRPKKAIFQPTL